jgi:hypothetical protein
MLVRLGMNRAVVGVHRKNHLCITFFFLSFNLNIRYILSAYWIRDTTPARHISLMYHKRMEKAPYFIN